MPRTTGTERSSAGETGHHAADNGGALRGRSDARFHIRLRTGRRLHRWAAPPKELRRRNCTSTSTCRRPRYRMLALKAPVAPNSDTVRGQVRTLWRAFPVPEKGAAQWRIDESMFSWIQ